MDFAFCSLAYADAIHDFDDLAINHKNDILSGLPGYAFVWNKYINKDKVEDLVRDIFMGRNKNVDTFQFSKQLGKIPEVCTPYETEARELFATLSNGHASFGLVCDANGASQISRCLECQPNDYYVLNNIENVTDSANSPLFQNYKRVKVLHDKSLISIKYPKWDTNACLSNRFCSKYDIELKYNRIDKNVSFSIGGIKYRVGRSFTDNENSKPRVEEFILKNRLNTDLISKAFQRKRSGDWLQSLSVNDTDRVYTFPSGESRKLNVPVYFCTEDRVAAAYSFALGTNTIYFHKQSTTCFIYKRPGTFSDSVFSCTSKMFNDMFIEEYRTVLREGYKHIMSFHETILVKMQEHESATTNEEILRYMGYIFQYSHVYSIFTVVLANKETVEQFIRNEMEPTNENKNIIMHVKDEIETWLPILLNHDLTSKPEFPCLDTFQPISRTGKVEQSELYTATLLCSFAGNVPILLDAIEKCVRRIVDLSKVTPAFLEHYNFVLDHCRTMGGMSGGTRHIGVDHVTRDFTKLGRYYIAYIEYYRGSKKGFSGSFNQVIVSKFNLITSESYVFCFVSLRSLVVNYGILREEFLRILKKESYTIQEESLAMLGLSIDEDTLSQD